MTEPVVIAIDVGGTTLKGAVVLESGEHTHVERRGTGRGGDAVAQQVADLAVAMAAGARSRGLVPVAAGVAVPGLVDQSSGVVRANVQFGWRDLPLQREVEDRLGLPVCVENDVRAAALGELRAVQDVGAATDFLFVALGTGVGGALVLDGRVRSGARGAAGEIGHVEVSPNGPACGCGRHGCLTQYVGSAGLARRYLEGMATSGRPRTPGAAELDGQAVAALARAGDPVAAEVWAEGVGALAKGIATCVALLDVGLVILGGGGAQAGSQLLEPLASALRCRLVWTMPGLRLAKFGADAGRVGAGTAAWRLVDRPGPREA